MLIAPVNLHLPLDNALPSLDVKGLLEQKTSRDILVPPRQRRYAKYLKPSRSHPLPQNLTGSSQTAQKK